MGRAPSPGNLIWENVTIGAAHYVARVVVLNFFMGLLLLFFTTPSSIWTAIQSIPSVSAYFADHDDYSVIVAYVPFFLMLLLAIALPYALIVSTALEGHVTKSILENWRLRKTYVYLVFYILILPGSMIASVNTFVEFFTKRSTHTIAKINLFADSGSFFINYVIQVSLLMSSFDLVRPHELAARWWKLWRSCTVADRIKAYAVRRFDYGLMYSWNLALLAVILSVVSFAPLIAPAGFLTFSFRLLVDSYNLFYVKPKHYDSFGTIINTALLFLVTSLFLAQLVAAIFLFYAGLLPQTILVSFTLVGLLVYVARRVYNAWHKAHVRATYVVSESHHSASDSDEGANQSSAGADGTAKGNQDKSSDTENETNGIYMHPSVRVALSL